MCHVVECRWVLAGHTRSPYETAGACLKQLSKKQLSVNDAPSISRGISIGDEIFPTSVALTG